VENAIRSRLGIFSGLILLCVAMSFNRAFAIRKWGIGEAVLMERDAL
jgi:hypothetical protein